MAHIHFPPTPQHVKTLPASLSITWKRRLAQEGPHSSSATPVWDGDPPRVSLTCCLHGGRQLPVLLCCHILPIGSFEGDALVAPLDVEVAARVPAGYRGWSAGCKGWGPSNATPGRAMDGLGDPDSIQFCHVMAAILTGSRQEAGSQRHFGVSASVSRGLSCREKHSNSPSRPGRITWPEGLLGWQSPNPGPALQGIHCFCQEVFWDERRGWKIPFGFPCEMQRGP